MAGALLREFGLWTEKGDLLRAALYAANICLSHELLDDGAQPRRGALASAAKSGDDALFARILQTGAVAPRDREALAAFVASDRAGMLRQLLDAARWPPQDPVLQDVLESACKLGRSACAEQLLQAGADPAATTALQAAARLDNVGLLRRLLATGRYDAGERALNEALEEACRRRSMECVEVLLPAGASPADTEALHIAVGSGSLDLVRILLGTGRYKPRCHGCPLGGALREACRLGDMEAMKVLLGTGVSPRGALLAAAEAQHVELVKVLLAMGRFRPPDGDMKDELKCALQAACRNTDFSIARELLGAGADWGSALRLAVQEGRTAFLRALLDWDPCMREPGLLRGVLHTACGYGCLAAVQALLDAGAAPEAGLLAASRRGCTASVRLLLGTGRCPPEGEEMRTALADACVRGHSYMVRWMLAAGAHPLDGLVQAAFSGRLSMVRMLAQAAGRCHHADSRATLALAAACRWGCAQTVQALLDAGVDPWAGLPEAANSRRLELTRMLLAARREDAAAMPKAPEQALWLACYRQDLCIVRELLAAGADPALALSCPAVRTNQELRDALLASGRCPPELLAAATAQTDGDAAATAQTACDTAAAGTAQATSGTANRTQATGATGKAGGNGVGEKEPSERYYVVYNGELTCLSVNRCDC